MATSRSTREQDAIANLRSILQASGTTSPDDDILATLLEVESWNVARAAKLVEEDSTVERRRSGADDETIARSFAQGSPSEAMSFDDSASAPLLQPSRPGSGAPRATPGGAGLYPHHRQPNSGQPGLAQIIWSTITFPFSVASSLLIFLARILRLRYLFPGLFGGPFDGRSRQMGYLDPRTCAENFIRELEEETGGSTSDNAHSGHPGQADAQDRAPARPRLPPLFVGGYSDALKVAKEQIKILVVILVSREHGDVERFKKTSLVDPDLVQLLSRPDFVVWGGDVREREAYQVATTLQASTYPFVAFIALQPPRIPGRSMASVYASASSSSSPRPAVLSRLEGSPLSATSASAIASHISDVLLPRTRTYLERLRAEQRRRELERQLKAEQDRAYAEASRRDAERVMKKREEERRKAEETQRLRLEQERKDMLRRKRSEWQLWAARELVPTEPSTSEASIRLSFRLPNGRTHVRHFRPSDSAEAVFAFVEAAAVLSESPTLSAIAKPSGYDHIYEFALVTGYPRRRIEHGDVAYKSIQDLEALSQSANLIVEGNLIGYEADAEEEEEDDSDHADA
ncbi:UBX-domain-containing protein [Testicularia cyperi]|uniref:UBX-domain-containing protein n=1 Tax=Testicularia cyperi TaxID=1882483 RepID=A0A317XWI7_9BASI|nr:UBX-domain-containing protein [Testicularia cyperi]